LAIKIKDNTPVEADYINAVKGPHARHFIPYPRSVVWNALVDAKAWTQWLPITSVEWTSPKPYKVGTTRRVAINENIVDETFIIWEDGSRMAFRYDRSGFPVTAGVEDYRIVDAPGGCEIQFTCRFDTEFPKGFLLNQQMRIGFRFMLPKLKKLIAANPKRFGG